MLLTGIGRDTYLSSWRLSRKEATNANFSKNEPNPIPQLLKTLLQQEKIYPHKSPHVRIS